MAGKPVGLLSELIILNNDNNDNAVQMYMEQNHGQCWWWQ